MAINYFINGVWKDTSKVITHVSLCKNETNGWYGGVKTAESEVIKLIEAGSVVFTNVWYYPNWMIEPELKSFNQMAENFSVQSQMQLQKII